MHEMALMQGLMAKAEEAIAGYRVERVNRMLVRAGVLANVLPEALQFAFEAISAGSVFAGAELCVEKTPLTARCAVCGEQYTSLEIPLKCPVCASAAAQILGGDEVILASIDFDQPDEEVE
ncbi:MAG: hydrogenase maturation nickel metallochaperone HypA [Bacillota bacterium]|nr:hydrogenase maturation nickel metallochaperone HypA [Bacillota bacterium]